MRSILFEIPLGATVRLGPLGEVPIFGVGLLLGLWVLVGLVWGGLQWWKARDQPLDFGTLAVWGVIAGAIWWAPHKQTLPLYGFGSMLFLAYLSSASLAAWRLRRRGLPGDIAWDVAIWIFLSGLIGGRTFFILQYHDRFFGAGQTLGQTLFRLVNLPDGGLVLYGGLMFAPLAYWAFCRKKGVRPLPLADLLIPLVFLGLMFGRLGCLMHGCCYGDYSEQPWAITFPADSAPYSVQVERGYLSAAHLAERSLPLHPTQIYDAVNALAICLLTWTYHPFRQRDGEVLALAWILYPINRFTIELLRWDESGQFGTTLTISQWGSFVVAGAGLAFLVWLQWRPPLRRSLSVATATATEPVFLPGTPHPGPNAP